MPTFALVSEGITDQVVLERMIVLICDDMFEDGVEINPLQPMRDATDAKTAPHGGWGLVLEYCELRISDALFANDYIVIHLDTDEGDKEGFDVPLTLDGQDRNFPELVSESILLMKNRLGEAFNVESADRFIFAVSVHSIESWLLLYLFDCNEPKNSLSRLNFRIRKVGDRPLKKEMRSYREVSSRIKKKKLMNFVSENHSLGLFLSQLANLGK